MRPNHWFPLAVVSVVAAAVLLVASGWIDVRIGLRDNVANAAGLLEGEANAAATPATPTPFWNEGGGAEPAVQVPSGAPQSFADLAERVSPAVVSIQAERTVRPNERQPRSPLEDFFGIPFGGVPRAGEGSGFVISADGYIVTNNHVVDDFDKIDVVFLDGTTLPARIVGRDSGTDVALLKVKSDRPLPSLPLGDSDRVRPGDWAVAIGNPFGLENTVTAGIVSAKHRRTRGGEGPRFSDFIQTDAAINPGNSGGPLLNLSGEVIGINTMIDRRGENIGFAVPVNLAKQVLPQLRSSGRVARGKLGVTIQPVDSDAAELLGLPSAEGALVNAVEPGSPAERAGIQRGDVIVEFDGKGVKEMDELPQLVAATQIGAKSRVTVLRKGKRQTLTVTVGELASTDGPSEPEGEEQPGTSGAYGLTVQTLTPEIAQQLRLDGDAKGVVVSRVQPGGPADAAGLQQYDVIFEVNQTPVRSSAEFKDAVGKNPKGALLLVRRGSQELFVTMKRSAP